MVQIIPAVEVHKPAPAAEGLNHKGHRGQRRKIRPTTYLRMNDERGLVSRMLSLLCASVASVVQIIPAVEVHKPAGR